MQQAKNYQTMTVYASTPKNERSIFAFAGTTVPLPVALTDYGHHLSALGWTRRFVSGVNEDRRLRGIALETSDQRRAMRSAADRPSAARVTPQRGAQKDG